MTERQDIRGRLPRTPKGNGTRPDTGFSGPQRGFYSDVATVGASQKLGVSFLLSILYITYRMNTKCIVLNNAKRINPPTEKNQCHLWGSNLWLPEYMSGARKPHTTGHGCFMLK